MIAVACDEFDCGTIAAAIVALPPICDSNTSAL